ncbi:MAG: rRNA adenine N-6-methyltransferase family protein [Minisyncoccia bacterium]
MDKSVNFLKNAIKGKNVGAVSRSSRYVIKEVLKNIDDTKLDVVVEFGPGDGVLTTELLKKVSDKGKLYAVELDSNFVKELRKIKDDRLVVIEEKMEVVAKHPYKYGIKKADLVVSSIPFTFINKKDREGVVGEVNKMLSSHGQFIIFHQYSLLMYRLLKKYFRDTDNYFEPRNILPCFIMVARK